MNQDSSWLPRCGRGLGAAALFLVSLGLLPAPAEASVFDVFGMTARATAMGGAQGAAAQDHAAVFYNPAALTVRKQTHLGVTIQALAPQLSIEQPESAARLARLPDSNVGFTLGAVFPLGGKIEDRVALGVALFLPLVQVTRYESIDPATPQFYLYQSMPNALVMAGSLAIEVFDWLSVGFGAQVLASFEGELDVAISLGSRRVERRRLDGDLLGELAPVVGILVRPLQGVALGFTYRDDLSLDFKLPVDFYTTELGLLRINGVGRGLYTPEQLNWAVAWELPWAPLRLACDLTWMRWSKAPSPALHVTAEFDTSGLDPLEPQTFLDLETVDPELDARDIVVPRFGAEWRFAEFLAVQAGYHYRASPIPDQVGYSSYADAATHVLSVGSSFTWDDPLEVHERPVTLDLFVQLNLLDERSVTKDPQQDLAGVRGWSASGTVWNLGIEWRHDF